MEKKYRSERGITARRVVEVLEYFDDEHPRASVKEISKRYGRPQSSTSEIMAALGELGLLFRDIGQKSYALSPRAAFWGSAGQPLMLVDGTLNALIRALHERSGLGTALFGIVGTNAQLLRVLPERTADSPTMTVCKSSLAR